MEIQVDDMTIGYQTNIPFSLLQDDNFQHAPTFKKMAAPDGSSYVIIYQWAEPMTKTYSDREEAFYIDNINENNKEKAVRIFTEVFDGLENAFMEDSNADYNMTELVNSVIRVKSK